MNAPRITHIARPHIARAATIFRGLAALIVLLGLVAGVPLVLVTLIGNPFASGWTSGQSWTGTITSDALLGVLACMAWLFWAQLIVCVVVEVLAEVRVATGRSAEWMARIPGTFGGQQALARGLVQAVVAIGAAGAVASIGNHWVAPAVASVAARVVQEPATAAGSTAAPVPPQPTSAAAEPVAPSGHPILTTVTVARGDTLWSIAETHLGAGERWREIAELNHGRRMEDGARFEEARTILPGWSLLIPARSDAGDSVVVEHGDTLWSIAEEKYGDGAAWPRIYDANDATIADPHWIQPGQRLVLPRQSDRTPDAPTHLARPPATETRPAPQAQPQAEPAQPDRRQETEEQQPPDAARSSGHHLGHDKDEGIHLDAATITRGLLGGGGFLAASILVLYIGRRRTQTRNRPSGRLATRVAPDLRAEEKAVRRIGGAALEVSTFFDRALRELAQLAADAGQPIPDVLAARIDAQRLELRLRTPVAQAIAPWHASPDGADWWLPRQHAPRVVDRMSPYPAIVTIGDDADGGTWFIDLEGAELVQVIGDAEVGGDLVRFMTAELALNPWADAEGVTVVGVAEDVVGLNEGRLFAEPELGLERLVKIARSAAEMREAPGWDVLGSRTTAPEDGAVPDILVAAITEEDISSTTPLVEDLLDARITAGRRTGVAALTLSERAITDRAPVLTAASDGGLRTPWGVVKANRLTAAEAETLRRLFDDADTEGDEPIPAAEESDGTMSHADEAGALTAALTETRSITGDPASVLPRPDAAYIECAATTPEDLAVLAPAVLPAVATEVLAQDPCLDEDLAAWGDPGSARPKLRVLGPVELRAVGEKTREVDSRPAYFTELTAYLACHPRGVTPNQVAADFGIQNNTLHTRLGQLRKWLGQKEDSDGWYLPNAGSEHGTKVYRLDGVLCDADLFKRLRSRGQVRGPAGVEDFRRALELVEGIPYDQQRPHGYGWLVDTPADHYLTAAVVDVAHVVATQALAVGDPNLAMWSAEKAILAAPSEDKPRLDLACALRAIGEVDDARELIRAGIVNRTDDDRAPLEPSERTRQVVRRLDH